MAKNPFGLVLPTQCIHLIRDLFLVASQLKIDTDRNRHKLLECTWQLGWHVTHYKAPGVTRHYWGGGVTPSTTSNYLRGDTHPIDIQQCCTTYILNTQHIYSTLNIYIQCVFRCPTYISNIYTTLSNIFTQLIFSVPQHICSIYYVLPNIYIPCIYNMLPGDWVEVAGRESIRHSMTSRLARVVCGVKISKLNKVFGTHIS